MFFRLKCEKFNDLAFARKKLKFENTFSVKFHFFRKIAISARGQQTYQLFYQKKWGNTNCNSYLHSYPQKN